MSNNLASDTRGAALLEAALTLPVLLLIVFAMTDLALYLWQANSAQKAVQLGARKAIVSPSVAVGAGLSPEESRTFWWGLPLGKRCTPDASGVSACPTFNATCRVSSGCDCSGAACKFSFSDERLTPIIRAMQAVLPRLRPDQVEISYSTNFLGYVGQPIPVPVDVKVKIINLNYETLFIGDKLGVSIPIAAAAVFPSEHMRSMNE